MTSAPPDDSMVAKQRAVALLGLRALSVSDIDDLMNAIATVTCEVLEVPFCKVLELLPGGQQFRLRAGVGWADGSIGDELIDAKRHSQAGYTLMVDHPVIVDDLATETRFHSEPLLVNHNVVSGVSVIIYGFGRPWGVLSFHSDDEREFSEDDVNFIQSIANVLAAAIERSTAEDALIDSESRLKMLIDLAPDAIFSLSYPDAVFTSISPAFEELTGYAPSEWIGKPFSALVSNHELLSTFRLIPELRSGVTPAPFELRVTDRFGRLRFIEVRVQPQRGPVPVLELFGIARDVTARKAVEEQLRNSRDELEIILQGVSDGIVVQDVDSELVYVNQTAAEMWGFTDPDAMLTAGARVASARFEYYNEDGERLGRDARPSQMALRTEQPQDVLLNMRRIVGEGDLWCNVRSVPALDQDNVLRYTISIYQDVTRRIQAEQLEDFLADATAILASSLRLDQTLETAAELAVPVLADLCVLDTLLPDGALRRTSAHVNPQVVRDVNELHAEYKISPRNPIGLALTDGQVSMVRDLYAPNAGSGDDQDLHMQVLRSLGFRSAIVVPLEARGRRVGVLSLLREDGSRPYEQQHLAATLDLAQRVAIAIDNAVLFRSSQQAAGRLRAFAIATDAVAEASLDTQKVFEAVVRSAGELIGDQCVLRMLDEERQVAEAVAVYHQDPVRRAQLADLHTGTSQPLDSGVIGDAIREGTPQFVPSIEPDELQFHINPEHLADHQRHPIYGFIIVLVRVRGRPIGTLGIARDQPGDPYTDQDLLVLQGLADRAGLAIENARLYREARDAAVQREQFLSIASHELKTPLTSVKASAQLLDRRFQQEPIDRSRLQPLIDRVQSEITRLENLVMDLLDATRIQQQRLDLRLGQTDLVVLARQVTDRFETAVHRLPSHQIEIVGDDEVIVTIDEDRIDQVMTNLVSNALKYSPSGGKVIVRITAAGDHATVEVRDQGLGISPDERDQLFEPFARGKHSAQAIGGTGLGLFISKEIVERHGGSITFSNNDDIGATFRVTLPRVPPDEGSRS